LPYRAEAQEKHDHRKHDVEPGVGRIIRHDPKRVAGVNGEAPNNAKKTRPKMNCECFF
jgi:hypothetical protein